VDFSESATTHGVYYCFERSAKPISRLFWGLVVLVLLGIAIWLIVSAFITWKNDPMLTTVGTTGLPVTKLPFPAITICGLGTIKETVDKVLVESIVSFYDEKFNLNITDDASELSNNEFLAKYGANYTDYAFPGSNLPPQTMAAAMSSENPDAVVAAEVAVGEYDPCASLVFTSNTNSSSGTSGGTSPADKCGSFDYVSAGEVCYKLMNDGAVKTYDEASQTCEDQFGDILPVYSDDVLKNLAAFISSGNMTNGALLQTGKWFWTTIRRNSYWGGEDYNFTLSDGTLLSEATLPTLDDKSNINATKKECYIIQFNATSNKFVGNEAMCTKRYAILCESYPEDEPQCDATTRKKRNSDSLDKLENIFDPTKKREFDKQANSARKEYQESFSKLNMSAAYENMFELLWYTQLPCFDVNGLTSTYKDQK